MGIEIGAVNGEFSMQRVDPVAGGAVRLGVIEVEKAQPRAAGFRGLNDLFIHLWTRLDEAHTISNGLSHTSEPLSDSMRRNLAALATIANVDNAYASMKSLLAEAAKADGSYTESLQASLSQALKENAELRAAVGRAPQ
ncbi:MAG TPA: hypothetical protein VMV99_00595 [Rhodanobacter sp.]|nr:hypothetical protein [Rhodanobacter sp.]